LHCRRGRRTTVGDGVCEGSAASESVGGGWSQGVGVAGGSSICPRFCAFRHCGECTVGRFEGSVGRCVVNAAGKPRLVMGCAWVRRRAEAFAVAGAKGWGWLVLVLMLVLVLVQVLMLMLVLMLVLVLVQVLMLMLMLVMELVMALTLVLVLALSCSCSWWCS
jgi:hypothetical protein